MLQLYWATLIAKQAMKLIAGDSKEDAKDKAQAKVKRV
jgi:hypothetical protein